MEVILSTQPFLLSHSPFSFVRVSKCSSGWGGRTWYYYRAITVVLEASRILTMLWKNPEIMHCMSTIGPGQLCIEHNSTFILALFLLCYIKRSHLPELSTIIRPSRTQKMISLQEFRRLSPVSDRERRPLDYLLDYHIPPAYLPPDSCLDHSYTWLTMGSQTHVWWMIYSSPTAALTCS